MQINKYKINFAYNNQNFIKGKENMKKSLIYLGITSSLIAGGMTPPTLGAIHGTDGIVLPKDSFVTAVKSVFVNKENIYDGSKKLLDPTKKDISVQRYNFIFRYGLGNDLDLRFLVPVFNKKFSMYHPKMKTNGDFKNKGIGDMRAFLRYQLTSQKRGDSFFSAIDLGIELPTGETDEDFKFDNGKVLPNHNPQGMQLGDGSIDPILGLSATKLMGIHRIDASSMLFLNRKGKNDFKKGTQFNYNLGYAAKIHNMFMPSLELNGKYSSSSKLKGKKLENTGGHELFLTPGFSSHLGKVKLLAGYSFPIYRNLNKGALGTKDMITVKLSYKW